MSDKDFLELCTHGDTEKVEQAILNGANVNAKDSNNWTALDYVRNRKPEIADFLRKYGAK